MSRSRERRAKAAVRAAAAAAAALVPVPTLVSCGECGAPMELQHGAYGRFYSCSRWPQCSGSHGAHPDGRPLGTPADGRTRRARVAAHAAFDRLWKGDEGAPRAMSRREAYRWLQRTLELNEVDAHIGRMDVEQCDRLIREVANHLTPETYHG